MPQMPQMPQDFNRIQPLLLPASFTLNEFCNSFHGINDLKSFYSAKYFLLSLCLFCSLSPLIAAYYQMPLWIVAATPSAGLAISFCCISGNFFDISSFDLCAQYIRSNTISDATNPIPLACNPDRTFLSSNSKGATP